jgi:hypothetical protein
VRAPFIAGVLASLAATAGWLVGNDPPEPALKAVSPEVMAFPQPTMLHVPAGSFLGRSDDCRDSDVHEMYGRELWIDATVATCDQLWRCEVAGACRFEHTTDWVRCEHGDAITTHDVASELCGWRGLDLPSYREWQRAALGTRRVLEPTQESRSCIENTRWLKHGCVVTTIEGFELPPSPDEEFTRSLSCNASREVTDPWLTASILNLNDSEAAGGLLYGRFRCVGHRSE